MTDVTIKSDIDIPQLGDIKQGRRSTKMIWSACIDCGKERWVQYVNGKPYRVRCATCGRKNPERAIKISQAQKLRYARQGTPHGAKSNAWRGGRYQSVNGYMWIWVDREDFFNPMIYRNHYVLEHRLVMAKSLGRNLHAWEIVHHRNGDKTDNRIENLQLVGVDQHYQMTKMEMKIDKLLANQEELRKEIRLLRFENKALREGLPQWEQR